MSKPEPADKAEREELLDDPDYRLYLAKRFGQHRAPTFREPEADLDLAPEVAEAARALRDGELITKDGKRLPSWSKQIEKSRRVVTNPSPVFPQMETAVLIGAKGLDNTSARGR